MYQQEIIDALKEMSNLKEQIMPHFMQAQSEILSHKEQEPNPIALGIQYAPKIVSNINLHLNVNPWIEREDLFKSTILPIRYILAFMDFYEQELLEKGFDLDYCRSYFTTLVEEVERGLKV